MGAFSDKAVLEQLHASFDVLVLQANLAASYGKALSSWSALPKPYWIDPIAYAFAASPAYLMSERKVRRGASTTVTDYKTTFRRLADEYGIPFTRAIEEHRELHPHDFADSGVLDVAVESVVEWQRHVLAPRAEDSKYFLAEGTGLEPALYTVPFFPLQIDSTGRPPWLEVNLAMANSAAARYPVNRSAVGLLIEEDLFDDETTLKFVVDQYTGVPQRHVWIWISDNDELNMTVARATRLRRLVRDLAERDKVVHQAFGGTFSSLLLADGTLTSTAHGVAYWEHKTWEPLAGGGVPPLRYFYPPLGARLRFLEADAIVDDLIDDVESFYAEVCGCAVCRRVLEGDLSNFARYGQVEVRSRIDRRGNRVDYDVPLPESLAASKRHYLLAKQEEVLRSASFDDRGVGWLRRHLHRHEASQQTVDLRHMRSWIIALSGAEDARDAA